MADDTERSVTHQIESLKAGGADTAQELWRCDFETLVRPARPRLQGAARAMADEEDDALSAFDSFCRGSARGRYPRLNDRDDLWLRLVVIAERKALDPIQRGRRQERGGGKILGILGRADADVRDGAIGNLASPEPTPEFTAIVADECRRLLGQLRDVARLKMAAYTNEEVADRTGCSLRTIAASSR